MKHTQDFSPIINSLTPSQSSSVDNMILEELREMMGDKFRTIIAAYLTDSINYLAAIADAVQNGDSVKVEKSAHALRSASGQVGALKLENYLGQLEDAAANNDLSGTQKILKDIQTEYENVRQALR